jgi:hypothetical protein
LKETFDLDWNGILDLSVVYTNGVPHRSDCWPNRKGTTHRIGEYVHGILRRTYHLSQDRPDPGSLAGLSQLDHRFC